MLVLDYRLAKLTDKPRLHDKDLHSTEFFLLSNTITMESKRKKAEI